MAAPGASADSRDHPSQAQLDALGERLRAARDARGLSLDDLATRLRMGREQLQALESADAASLPETVFVIAQARRVAASLDLCIDQEVAALRRNPPPPAAPPAQSTGRQGSPTPVGRRDRPPRRNPAWLGLLAVAGVGTSLVLALRQGVLGWGWLPPGTAPGSPVGGAPPPPRPPAATAPATDLALTPRGPSWVEVTTPAGQSLFRGMLTTPRRFPLGEGLQVLAGRPDLVSVRVADGPARILGPIDQVRWYRFPHSTAPLTPAR